MIVNAIFSFLGSGDVLGGKLKMKPVDGSFAVFGVSEVVDTGVDCGPAGNRNSFVWFGAVGTGSLIVEEEGGKNVALDVVGTCDGKTKGFGGPGSMVDVDGKVENGVFEGCCGSVSRFCLLC